MTEPRATPSRGSALALSVGVVSLALVVIVGAVFLANRGDPAAAEPFASAVARSSTPSEAPSATASEEAASPAATEPPVSEAGPSVAEATAATPGDASLQWTEGTPISGQVETGAWIGERWVILGGAEGRAAVWESTDASSWTAAPPIDPAPVDLSDPAAADTGPGGHSISAIADWNGVLVGAGVHRFGYGDGLTMSMWTSRDGQTWEHTDLADIDIGGTYPRIAVAPDERLVIIGNGALGSAMFVYSTTDGETWEAARLFGEDPFHSMTGIAGGPPTLVGVGSHSRADAADPTAAYTSFTRIYTSPDWTTWEALVDGPPGHLTSVAYDNQSARFVAAGAHEDAAMEHQSFPVVWLSEDGRAWRPVVIDPGHGTVADVGVANGVIVAAGTRSESGEVVIWESADGVTWSVSDLGAAGVPRLVAHEGEVLLLVTTCCDVEETLVWTTTVSP